MNELKANKSFQFIMGCMTIASIWYLHKNQVFAFLLDDSPPEGLESTSLAALVLTSLVSAIQLCGIISIAVVSGILKPLAEWCVDAIRNQFPKVDKVADKIEDVVDDIDVDKLIATLNDFEKRLRKVEGVDDD